MTHRFSRREFLTHAATGAAVFGAVQVGLLAQEKLAAFRGRTAGESRDVSGRACRSSLRLRYEPERRSDHIGFRVAVV